MKFGITMFATDQAMNPVELAREAEQRGFTSLFLPEHTHIPTSRRTPPPTGDEVLAEEYKRTLDPYIALAAAASVTERIRLGTGIALVAQHDPITYAKELATLDLLSEGRLVLGIGYGWNHEEMENHGIDVKRRRARVRETLLAMQVLWTEERASFDGEFIQFEESWQWPKPLQQPRPPVLLGGAAGPTLFRHIAEYGDGWLPIGGAGMKASLDELRRVVESAGRRFEELEIMPMGVLPTPEKIAYYRDLGVTESVLRVPGGPRDEVLPVLDAFAAQYVEA
ncbi:MAG: LLM class F420-dependent oxidoreductase [Myxococcota bacterium]